jgi:uncharacterized membrane protein
MWLITLLTGLAWFALSFSALAQNPLPATPLPKDLNDGYHVVKLESMGSQTATVRFKGQLIEAALPTDTKGLRAGEQVVVYVAEGRVFVAEPYRLNYLWVLLGLFVFVTVVLGRGKGVRGLLGTASSMAMLALFIVPEIAKGNNPLLITFLGAFGILVVSIYFVHGVNRKTSAALAGTTMASLVSLVMAVIIIEYMQFTGFVSEDAFYAQRALGGNLDLISLYLAGVVVGALGALNDVTVTQASVIQALVQANPRYTVRELYQRGMEVGFDHIGSLVNTLILAYSAGSLPLLLLIQSSGESIFLLLNREAFAAEAVSMLVGSLALVLAVPLTTLIAAWLLRGKDLDFIDRRWPKP